MTDPFADDSWDELTRELGVEKTPPREPEPSIPATEDGFADEIDLPGIEVDSQSDEGEFDGDLGDEAEGDAPDGAEPPSGDEQPGPGRKRRRRRRRRKKGPGEGEATDAAPGEEPGEPIAPVAPRPARAPMPARVAREEPEYAETEFESGAEDEEPAGIPLAAEEDTAGEVLREMIANWNVPSWDSIITGLNRPH